ncbi:MAG: class I SAM-dependent methyltransferase [Candidatus Omnitrophica bacterium]|nr:class I SAM-dependent methyltransferase [Candidatus Omnitrophota bacterium]MDD5080714.1 class I SAM-dependent methyltransferase [Candidatus Omnitrophota bacterium]MDD5440678.1 class I SAM-dependent methyltransferase [Candidatus Omnitrophota bacterium]
MFKKKDRFNYRNLAVVDKDKKYLDFGCKTERVNGAIGVDIDPGVNPDVLHDLSEYPYPFEAGSVDGIFARHIIEHLGDPGGFVGECHRILKQGGFLYIETPHFSNYVAYAEPQHKLFYSYFMVRHLFNMTQYRVDLHEITFHRRFRRMGIKYLANIFPLEYERFWTYIFSAENVRVILEKK